MRQYIEQTGFAAFSVALLGWGFVEGWFPMTFQVDLSFLAVAVGVLKAELDTLTFAGFLGVSGVIYFVHRFRKHAEEAVLDGPPFTAIVPVYGDGDVLHRSVGSLLDSEYGPLEIVIVTEQDDDATQERAADLAEDHDEVTCLVNEGATGSKAGAINYALEQTESEYVGVFDADEVVDEAFVPHCVGEFEADADVDVVQGRTVPEPNGFVESLAYYESVLMSFVVLRIAYALTGFRMAVSRCIAMRRSTLEDLGGYDTEMLTEDFAFTYECYKERVTVREMLDHPSRIDAAHTPADWWGQRKRWMTGYTQVLVHQLKDIRPVTDYRNLVALFIAFSAVSGSFFLITMLSKFAILLWIGATVVFTLPIALIYGITLGAHLLDYRQGAVGRPTLAWLVVPLVFPLYSLAAVKALFEYLGTWEGEWYRVVKEA